MKDPIPPYGGLLAIRNTTPGDAVRRRTEITIETREIKTIRIRSTGGTTYCARCGVQAASYTPEHVAVFLQLAVSEVVRSMEEGRVHIIGGRGDADEICGNSIGFLINDEDRNEPTESIENTVHLLNE